MSPYHFPNWKFQPKAGWRKAAGDPNNLPGKHDVVTEESKERRSYYDVDKFRRVYEDTLKARKGLWKFLGRFTRFVDSIQGIFVALASLVIVYGTLGGVILGAQYGLVVFLVVFGSAIGGLALLVEKKVGRSIQFGDFSFWKRTLGQLLAFLIMGAIVAVILAVRFNFL